MEEWVAFKVQIIGHRREVESVAEIADFSRARWFFRQCAWPARRHARKNSRRAREKSAMNQAMQAQHDRDAQCGPGASR